VVKLLGTGFCSGAWWRDVEVLADSHGAPTVRLHRGAATIARDLGAAPIALSITHKGPWAVAVAACAADSQSPVNP
jgi:holo-[acyl-carrier protein] synthase